MIAHSPTYRSESLAVNNKFTYCYLLLRLQLVVLIYKLYMFCFLFYNFLSNSLHLKKMNNSFTFCCQFPLSILSDLSKKFASSHLAPFILASAERYTCLCYVASPTETTGEKLVTKSRITSETDLSRMWL